MNFNQFWLVWNPNGRSPVMQHLTAESAETEAKRLARMSPGQLFFVLAPTFSAIKNDIQVTRFAVSDVPF